MYRNIYGNISTEIHAEILDTYNRTNTVLNCILSVFLIVTNLHVKFMQREMTYKYTN